MPVEIVEGDLLDDGPTLQNGIKGCDYVFHCAAITDRWANTDLIWRVNYDGTKKVLDACLQEGVKRLIYVGSASCFGFGTLDKPGDEATPFSSAYSGVPYQAKKLAMNFVQKYVIEHSLDAVIIAPTFMVGPLDWLSGSGEMIRQYIKRKTIFSPSGGQNFTFPLDVADVLIAAIDRGIKGESYIAGGHNLTYMDFFSKVARIAGKAPPRRILPGTLILEADGTLVPPDRPTHHTQTQVAKSILRMIERRKRRLVMTPLGYFGWLIYRISPGLVERVLLRAQSSQSRIFKKFS